MYEELETGFARHKGGVSQPYSQHLWENQQIAIHWKDLASTDPEDYEGRGSTEISKLNDFAEEGRIVGASYRRVTKTEMLVGKVDPGSSVKILYFEGDRFVEEKEIPTGEGIKENEIPKNGRILKGLQLSDVRRVSIEDYPVIFESSVRPPFWSISNWENGEPHLRAIINDANKPFQVSSLTPDEIEVICEEYLRIVDDHYRSLATVGGQTADVDITGVSDDKRIWGQVTMGDSGKVRKKLETLMQYSGESTSVLMFAPEESKPDKLPEGVTYLPVETIFETVALNESGQSMLEQMLNIPSST